MFKLFSSGNKSNIIDRVFIRKDDKWAHCKKILTENSNTIFIAWFDETVEELETYLSRSNLRASIVKARTANRSQIEGSQVIFVEHYPMKSREQQFLEQLSFKEAIFLTALDEPLLSYFGGEKLIRMMEGMGMKEGESLEHKLITQSIANAQEKIGSKVFIEQSTRSAAEWMERNLK